MSQPNDSPDPYRPDPITIRVRWGARYEVAQDALGHRAGGVVEAPAEHPFCPGYFVTGLSIVADGDPSSPVALMTLDYGKPAFDRDEPPPAP